MLLSNKPSNQLKDRHLVGVISDTHGLLRPEVLKALEGVSLIIHAGDVGAPAVLERLKTIAPVVAVRGNTDKDGSAGKLPLTEVAEIGGVSLYVLHDLGRLDLNPAVSGFSAVIHGHTHEPAMEKKNKVLFFNPGSAGPTRFSLPVSIGLIIVKLPAYKAGLLKIIQADSVSFLPSCDIQYTSL